MKAHGHKHKPFKPRSFLNYKSVNRHKNNTFGLDGGRPSLFGTAKTDGRATVPTFTLAHPGRRQQIKTPRTSTTAKRVEL
jgi:hypothetical protein